MQGLQNGTDIAVQIPIFGRGTVQNNNSHTQFPNNNTQQMPFPSTNNNDTSTGYDSENSLDNLSTTQVESISTTFSEQDKINIRELCEFGFQENHVIRIYIMANRNKELAASMLYELSE